MAELLMYNTYVRQFTLFKQSQLDQPVVYPIARLQLPKKSILHSMDMDGIVLGPTASDPLLRRTPGVIYIDHVLTFTGQVGSPIKTPGVNSDMMITEFRKRNRVIRPLKNLERLETDDRSLVVFNYSMLAKMVHYAATFKAGLYKWTNIYGTAVHQVAKLAEVSNRHQFIELELPDVMPTLTELRTYRSSISSASVKPFRAAAAFTIADLFIWAGRGREASILNHIKREHYSKVNFLVRRLNGWVVINLGWLDQWRQDPSINRKSGFDQVLFELKLLKLLMSIHQATSPVRTETSVDVLQNVDEELTSELDQQDLEALELNIDDEDESDITELENEADLISKLEKELEDLEREREASAQVEITDDDGNVTEVKTINTSAMTTSSDVVDAPVSAILAKAETLNATGVLTNAEVRRLERVSEVFARLPDPFGSGQSIVDAMKITAEDVKVAPETISTNPVLIDKSIGKVTIDAFERSYIDKVLNKDILNVIASIQNAPLAITDYTIQHELDAVNDRQIHSIRVAPAVGKPSTLKIIMPVLKSDGTFLYNGTRYRMRAQRVDLPIRKVSATRVGLTSYYGKTFIERTERSRFNYARWLTGQLIARALDDADQSVTDSIITSVANHNDPVPYVYSVIAEKFSEFNVAGNRLGFDYKRRQVKFTYTPAEMELEKDGFVLVGRQGVKPLLMAKNGMIYLADGKDMVEQGTVEALAGIDIGTAPTVMAEIRITRPMPLGIALGYLLGLENLLKKMKLTPRRVYAGDRLNLAPHEYAVRFKDESLIFDRSDMKAALVFSGFNLYQNAIRNYSIATFDKPDVYTAVLERSGLEPRYLKELDSLNMLFVDPITKDLLEWMKEPTDFVGLLMRSVEMLSDNVVEKRRKDATRQVESFERVRGYERFAGFMYETLSKSVRSYMARSTSGRASVTVAPNDAMTLIVRDATTSPINNINPVHCLREREVITFGGRGGRSRRSMVASTRLYHEEDTGLISEGSVDSGDVGIITYMAPNANLTTNRGTIRLYDAKTDGPSTLYSSAMLLSPAADGDDPKRQMFITVQHGHGIAADGNQCQGLRTGAEAVLAARMAAEFASVAQKDGEVTELTDTHIVVKYNDGEELRVPLGLVHTTSEGTLYPNTLLTELKLGDKVAKEDVVSYNKGFFQKDPFNERRVNYTHGVLARVALREAIYTLEDSTAISEAFAKRMNTQVAKEKAILVEYNQDIHDLVKPGQAVDLDTILCTIEDAVSSGAGLFDDGTRDILRAFAAMTPAAKVVGTVDKIEVYYNGDVELMSESLQVITAESDKQRRRTAKKLGYTYTSGQVPRNVRIKGHTLEAGQALIVVYMTQQVGMSIADKLVFTNQMKSTVGDILFGNTRTLSGKQIDAIFGAISCLNRIVTSPFVIGSVNTYLANVGEEAYYEYFGRE